LTTANVEGMGLVGKAPYSDHGTGEKKGTSGRKGERVGGAQCQNMEENKKGGGTERMRTVSVET